MSIVTLPDEEPAVDLMVRCLSRGEAVLWPDWAGLSSLQQTRVREHLSRVGLHVHVPDAADFPQVRAVADPRD